MQTISPHKLKHLSYSPSHKDTAVSVMIDRRLNINEERNVHHIDDAVHLWQRHLFFKS